MLSHSRLTISTKSQRIRQRQFPNYKGTQEGYYIYYIRASVNLSRVQPDKSDTTDKALRIAFDLPPDNWLSIHKQYPSSLDLSGFSELEIYLQVEVATANVRLHITLIDSMDDGSDGDEMWWYDCDRSLFRTASSKWIRIRIPLNAFYLSYGIGSRHNDDTLNLKKIYAYELNLISDARKAADGRFCVNSFKAYK